MEQYFTCPYCGAWVSVLLDVSVVSDEYFEDCEVCCRLILFSYETNEESLIRFSCNREDD